MKTTLDLNDALIANAKAWAAQRRTTLTRIVEDGLRMCLQSPRRSASAAARSDHPHHTAAYAWLTSAVASSAAGASLLVFPLVLASFLRLVTNQKFFARPTGIATAIAFADALLLAPGVRMPPLADEWQVLRASRLEKLPKANDLPDAWLAAAVQANGDHLVTFDKGLRRYLKKSELTLLG